VHDTDSAEHAAHLARRTALAEGVHVMPARPVLHGDNGATLKATTVLAMLHWLGIRPSYSRPRVSDDNAFAEALFRTASIVQVSTQGLRRSGGRQAVGDAVRAVVTTNTSTAASAMLPIPAPCWPGSCLLVPATQSIMRANAIHGAGAGTPATGRRSVPSRLIRSATLSFRRHPKSGFPVRLVSPLSRPDLATSKPRSAAKEMGGAEPPAATRSALHCASMARMARTGPSPQ
jgi:hypothetical protein